jgi:hypothetical protein
MQIKLDYKEEWHIHCTDIHIRKGSNLYWLMARKETQAKWTERLNRPTNAPYL